MFQDQFLPNLIIFALGVAAALFWLRTGMVRRGAILLCLLVAAADVALVFRFVHDDRGPAFVGPLVGLQIASIASAGWLLFKLARRRWGADSKRRHQLLQTARKHYLRDELRPAANLFSRLRRANPWDVAATLGLADIYRRQARFGRARALYRRAKRLDRRDQQYADLIDEQLRRCQKRPTPESPGPQPPPAKPSKPVELVAK